jgi:hypothetical protein
MLKSNLPMRACNDIRRFTWVAILVAAGVLRPSSVSASLIPTRHLLLEAADYVLDDLGGALDVEGNTLITSGVKGGQQFLCIFERHSGGTDAWRLTAAVRPAGEADTTFFTSLAVCGDLAVVGKKDDGALGNNAGAAFIFYRNRGGPDCWGFLKKIAGDDTAIGDRFGAGVDVYGDQIAVGASSEKAFYIFARNTGGADQWGQVRKVADPQVGGPAGFGAAVALHCDTLVVGNAAGFGIGIGTGAAYLFERNAGGADNWGQVTKLFDAAGFINDLYGNDVAIYEDSVVIGAPDDDFGGAGGSVFVYARNRGGPETWGQVAKLASSDDVNGDNFGEHVAIYGDTIMGRRAGTG